MLDLRPNLLRRVVVGAAGGVVAGYAFLVMWLAPTYTFFRDLWRDPLTSAAYLSLYPTDNSLASLLRESAGAWPTLFWLFAPLGAIFGALVPLASHRARSRSSAVGRGVSLGLVVGAASIAMLLTSVALGPLHVNAAVLGSVLVSAAKITLFAACCGSLVTLFLFSRRVRRG